MKNNSSTSDEEIETTSKADLEKLMNIDYVYPEPDDKNLQNKIYKKREFYYNKIPNRPEFKEYNEMHDYRENICVGEKGLLLPQQAFVGNFINPSTPYRGVLLFHGVGTGKCITGDQLVYMNNNLYEIEKIWNNYNSSIKIMEKDGGQWSMPKEDLYVNSYNSETGKMIKAKVNKLYRQPISEEIREITFENGMKIKMTNQHKLLIKDKNWTNELCKGDYVCLPKYLKKNDMVNTLNVTPELCTLLAWQISDQYCTLIKNTDKYVLNKIMNCIKSVSKQYNLNFTPSTVQINSKEYIKFLEKNGYSLSNLPTDKSIPNFIMNSSDINIIRLFLVNYFDAESSVHKSGVIEISSASYILTMQLYHLLKLFGISSRLKEKSKMATTGKRIKTKYHVLYIYGSSLQTYQTEIGYNIKYKQDILKKACKKKCNSNTKILSDLWKEIKLPKTKILTNQGIKDVINNLDSMIHDKQFQKKYSIDARKLSLLIIAKHDLEKELTNDLEYHKIQKIKTYKYTGFVYDLEIEKHHNYVVNGILTHNTCSAITIAEKFKPMVQKYGTKIHILLSGPLLKDNWKDELLKCTGETYIKHDNGSIYVNDIEKQKAKKIALNAAMQYYRFMSYRSFYKKVLGEKIRNSGQEDEKRKAKYRKTDEGEFERDIAIDRIYNLNNTLLIVDEAHNLTGNDYGNALAKIIKNSYNLKIVLLTATPMKNLADDIIELINFIRPPNNPIMRDRIFSSHKNHEMQIKEGGIEYFKKMASGYVSHLRGADPLTFAKRIDKGEIPKGLFFTSVTRCLMLPFQRKTYDDTVAIADDTLDRRSEAVANFAFPGIDDKKNLVGYYGNEGIDYVKNQLKINQELINKKIALEILKDKSIENDNDLLYLSDSKNNLTGKIFQFENLKYFSIKFYKALKKLNRLVWQKKGAKTAFVYSNLVRAGIEIFQEILLVNGYLEYDENPRNYKITPNTRCYFCGLPFSDHKSDHVSTTTKPNKNISESSTEYKKESNKIPIHEFHPATFVVVTGKSSEESGEIIPEEKQYILRNVFSNLENINGKNIKFVLGSKVMNEGISLKLVSEVHILDVYFNLGKVDQVIGRAIRHCSHYQLMNEENPFPKVNVYKYCVKLDDKDGKMSTEEDLYKKAELKYVLIKKMERAMKEVAIDCALNRDGNIFPEEIDMFDKCIDPSTNDKNSKKISCPAICDFTSCNYKCDNRTLNEKYFEDKINNYRSLNKGELDYSTFTKTLAKNEINNVKEKVKEMFKMKYLYKLKDIVNYVKNSYEGEKKELFDDFFVFEALNELTPTSENDFNNFKDTLYDKYNRPGYLIYRDVYYIFQPFDQNENAPISYRSTYHKTMKNQLSLYNYLKNVANVKIDKDDDIISSEKVKSKNKLTEYDFDSVLEYYENREEFKYVGIIDKESSRRKTKKADELNDVFKIREKRPKILAKKRKTGLFSMFGSVCATSKDKEYLEKVAKELKIKVNSSSSIVRLDICDKIKDELLNREKYGTDKKKNKFTYVMIPKNHKIYPFPYNLEDRKNYIIDDIKEKIKFKLDLQVKEVKKVIKNENVVEYIIEIKDSKNLEEFTDLLKSYKFKKIGKNWIVAID